MRLITLLVLLISTSCFAQFKDAQDIKNDSVKTIILTPLQESKLIELDNKIQELQVKQKELLEFILDSNKVDINRVKSLKYENGKLIYGY